MVKTMKFVIFLTIWALTTKTSYQIYDPGDQNQKPVTYTAGIKTSSYRRPSQIEFHHNYSKVFPDNYNNDNSEEIDASRRPFPVYNAHTYGARPQSERLTQVYVINGTRIRPNVNPARQIVIYKKRKRTPKIEIYRGCPVNATGQFVYEFSCNQFLNCWKGRGYVQNCAPGTLFNPKTLECDYPEKVTCVSGPRLSVLEEERSAKIIKQVGCPKEFSGLIPNYTDCSKFINCVNGIENLMDCPPGTLFDIDKNICDFAHKANCFNGENQNLTKRVDGSGNCNKQFCSDERNLHKRHQERVSCPQGVSGLYKHPTDCSKFLNCAEGRTYIQDCAPGTRFNPFLKICDFPYNVRCENVEEDITNPPATHYPPTIGYQPARIEYGRDYVSGTSKNSNNQYESINQQKGEIGCVGSANCGSTDRYRNQYNQPERGTYGTSSRYDGNQYNQNHHHQGSVGTHQTGYEQETGTYGQSNWNQNRYYKATAAGTHRETNIYNSSSNYYKGSASGHQNLYGQQSGGYDTSGIYREQNNWSQDHRNKGYVDPHTGTVPDISTNYYNKGFTSGHRNLYEQQSGGYDTSAIYRDQNNWGQVHHNKGYFDPRKGSVRVYYPENRKGNQYETSSTGSVGQQSGVYVTSSIYDTEPNNWGQDRYNQGHQQTGTWNPHHTDNYRGNQSGIHVTTYSHGERPGNNWRQDGYNQGEVINIGNPQHTRGYKGNHQGWVKGSNAQNNWDPNRATGTSYQNNRWNQGTSTFYPSPNQHNRQNQDNQYTRPSGETGTLWEQGPIVINNQQNYNGLEQQEWQPSKGENVYRFIKGSNNNWQQNIYHNKGNYDSNWRDGNRLDQQLTPNYDQVVNINEHTRTTTPPYRKPYESSYGTTRNPRVQHSNDYDDTFGSSSNHNVATTPKIVEKNWPPPFPSTDVNADYVFEYDDDEVSLEAENSIKDNHKKNGCGKSDFRCTQDVCIPKTLVCNGARDCQNGQDELHCLDYVSKFSVNKGHKLAILEKERWDNVTIATCALMCIETQKFLCKSFNYRMIDKTCFLSNTNEPLTGALISYNPFDYYELISEKIDCSDMYVCSNKKCIQRKQICDGHDDCGDRMDEKGCKPEDFGYKVKLVGSQHKNEGAIQVTAFGKVGYICDDGFHLNDAKVACKELGYPLGAVEVKGNSFYAKNLTGSLFYMMDDVGCVGNESRLMDCDFSGWGVHNCKGQEIVGVVCKTALERCPADYWQCETGQECLPLTFVCDNVLDCTDESDEATHLCDAPTEIRLANGTSRQEGRVEIKHNGIWGTICDDDFNEDAAKVVCRHLGYKGSAIVKKDGYFGSGTGPIWLDQVFCSGNETSLESCSHWNWGEHNCEHSEDVGVICSNIYHHERSAAVSVPELPQVYPDKCGYRKDNIFNRNDEVHFRVVKGSIAEKGEYPWQAAIRVKGKSKAAHWCGAVIISEKFVLTAAHCLIGYPKGAYIVVAGDYNIDEYEGTEQESYIEDYYIHENFRQGHKMNNDIALVKLKGRGFRLNDDVQVICLPEANATYEDNLNCTISGFGSIESGKSAFSHNLRAGWIPLQKREICTMPHVYGNALTDGMFCAGSLDEGIDACDGDSGGPLACLNNGVFTLYGITSWGQHCGYANKPGVYVKIAHYRKWIDDNFHKHSTTQK